MSDCVTQNQQFELQLSSHPPELCSHEDGWTLQPTQTCQVMDESHPEKSEDRKRHHEKLLVFSEKSEADFYFVISLSFKFRPADVHKRLCQLAAACVSASADAFAVLRFMRH